MEFVDYKESKSVLAHASGSERLRACTYDELLVDRIPRHGWWETGMYEHVYSIPPYNAIIIPPWVHTKMTLHNLYLLLWFAYEMPSSPHSLWMIGPQIMALLGEVVKILGCGSLENTVLGVSCLWHCSYVLCMSNTRWSSSSATCFCQ